MFALYPHPRPGASVQCSLAIAALFLLSGYAQTGVPGIQFVNADIPAVLRRYEDWTGKHIILDANLQNATITILANREMTDEEKAIFVEKSLLLNGYALIPSGQNLVKAVSVPSGEGMARSEGLEVFADPKELPESDRLVAYVMRFDHLGAEAAAAALTSIFPPHGYGTIVPFPQASAVVITDSSATIRRYLDLKPHIDVPRQDVPLAIREFSLERGDAAKVVEALNELLSVPSPANPSSGSATAGGAAAPAAPTGSPGAGTYAQVASLDSSAAQTLLQTPSPDKPRVAPKIRADTRTNKVLAVAEPKDMDYIETLVGFLDSPAPQRTFYTRQLHYLRVATLLENLPNVLQPGLEPGGSTSSTVAGSPQSAARPHSSPSIQNASPGSSRIQGTDSSCGSSALAGGRGRNSLDGFQFSDHPGPQSIVIDKTFVMADNVHNRILASGPVEHLELIDALIDELDQQPKQIQISAIIAQLSLGNDLEFGIDLLRSVDSARHPNLFAGSSRNRAGPIVDINTLLGVANFTPLAQGLTLYGKIDEQLHTYLSALQATNRFKVLDRPTIYTQNDRVAVISTGKRIAVPSSTLSTLTTGTTGAVTSTITYEDVLLEIRVQPLINSDDQVTLNILQVNDDIVGSQNISGNDIPTIGTQQLATTVAVRDGGTVLLGGLISEDDKKTKTGLPRFVALPLVGPLFGNSKREQDREELLVFIQPRIISDPVDLSQAQGDVQARTALASEVMPFAASPIRSEAEPLRKPSLINRLFPRKPRPASPEPAVNPVQPAPVLNPRPNLP